MRRSHTDEKILNEKVKKLGMANINKDMGYERYLEIISNYRQFDDKNMEMKMLAMEVVELYFRDGITYHEFMELVFRDYPDYIDNYTFNIYLGQFYRRRYSKSLHDKEKNNDMLMKLVKRYNKRYR